MIYLYVLLLRLVAYLEGPAKIISFVVVFFMISYSTIKRIAIEKLKSITIHNFYVIFLCLIIFVQSIFFGKVLLRDVAVLLTYWLWFVFCYTYLKGKTIRQCLKYTLITFLIFNFTNFLHYKLFFADQKFSINSILSIFGIQGYRIYFQLSSGANIFTSQLALNSLVTLFFVKTTKRNFFYILIYLFYFYMLVIADSRLILLFSLTFSLIYWFSLKVIIAFLKKFWWVISLLFFGFLYIFYATSFFDAFKRAGEIDGHALSRIKIWSMAKDIILNDYHFLSGYGLNGFETNLPNEIKLKFIDQHLQTSHNFFIQNIIDFGLIGIIIIIYLIFKVLKLVIEVKSQIITILIVMLLFMGITESIPTFYSFEPTLFFITILAILLSQNERKIITTS